MATTPASKTNITPKPKVYLTNKVLMEQVLESKELGRMSDGLARSLTLLTERYSKKGNFVNYTYNDDMRGYAMLMLVRTWHGFDPARSNNPFAFFTQCIKNSFIQYLNQESRQRVVRDELLITQGLNPSYGYSEGSDSNYDDEQDFESAREAAEVLRKLESQASKPIERDDMGEIITTSEFEDDDSEFVDLPQTPEEPENA